MTKKIREERSGNGAAGTSAADVTTVNTGATNGETNRTPTLNNG